MTIRTPGLEVLIGIVVMILVAVMNAQVGQILIAALLATDLAFSMDRKGKSARPVINVAAEKVTQNIALARTEDRAYILASQASVAELASPLHWPHRTRYESSRWPSLAGWTISTLSTLRCKKALSAAKFGCFSGVSDPLKSAITLLTREGSYASHFVFDEAFSRTETRLSPIKAFLQKHAPATFANMKDLFFLAFHVALFRAEPIWFRSTVIASPEHTSARFTSIGFGHLLEVILCRSKARTKQMF